MKLIDKITSLDKALRAYATQTKVAIDPTPVPAELITDYESRPRIDITVRTSQDIQDQLHQVTQGAIVRFKIVREGISRSLILNHPDSDGVVQASAIIETWLSPELHITPVGTECTCPDFSSQNPCSHVRDHSELSELNPNFLATIHHAWAHYDPYMYHEYSGEPVSLESSQAPRAIIRLLAIHDRVTVSHCVNDSVSLARICRIGANVRVEYGGVSNDVRTALRYEAQRVGWRMLAHKDTTEFDLFRTFDLWGDKKALDTLVVRDIDRIESATRIEWPTSRITGGWCDPTGYGFGLEIEFAKGDRPHVVSEVGQQLCHAGFIPDPHRDQYHEASDHGWDRWFFENDSSVDGEIVSPILHDTHEDWALVQKVYNVLNDCHAVMTRDVGLHVNMGIPCDDPVFVKNLLFLVGVFQDVLWRSYASPERKVHRNTGYAQPFQSMDEIASYGRFHNRYRYGVLNVIGNRVEFRGPDGSLDFRHAQSQVAIAAGLLKTAQRLTDISFQAPRVMSRVGTNMMRKSVMATMGVSDQECADVGDVDVLLFLGTLFDWDEGIRLAWESVWAKGWQRG